MSEIYLAFLIFGGGLLAYSILFGGGDSDTSTHTDLNSGNLHHFHLGDSGNDTTQSLDTSHTSDISHSSVNSDAIKYFSFRSFIYFSAFFGLTGTVLGFTNSGNFINFISSLFIGTISAYSGLKFFKYLSNSQSGEAINTNKLIGKTGHVSLDIQSGSKGKIIAEISGQNIEIAATLAENSSKDKLIHGEEVYILEVISNKAIVIEKEKI